MLIGLSDFTNSTHYVEIVYNILVFRNLPSVDDTLGSKVGFRFVKAYD